LGQHSLLVPIEGAKPSGENLEYEPVFQDLVAAATPGEERQVGEEIVAGDEPNYKDVIPKAQAVLEKSHDVRAAVFLALAELKLNGFPGFESGTKYIADCLEEYWESCHPELDADDDNDPTMRVNAVLGLADISTVLPALRQAPMTKSPAFGLVSLRTTDIAEGELIAEEGVDNVLDLAGISAAFQDTPDDVLEEIAAAVDASIENVSRIDSVFNEQTPGRGPNLEPVTNWLKRAKKRMALEMKVDEGAAEEEDAEVSASTIKLTKAASAGIPGAINSTADVRQTLERLIEYYQRNEPSSPIPILLERAKRLVGADFLTIVKDIAPSGVDNVNTVGGLEEESY